MLRLGWLLVGGIGLLAVPAARADRLPDLTPLQQVFQADSIIIGKVASIEAELVEAVPYPNSPKVGYQVGSITISEGLFGAKGLTQVRVGFIPRRVDPNAERFGRGYRGVEHTLTVDQEACFFLKKHPEADFYTQIPFGPTLDKKRENYAKELESVRKVVKALNDPLAALKAPAAAERELAACALVMKYRSRNILPSQKLGSEPVPAEESKLILLTLAGMEWNKFNPDGVSNLSSVFPQLGLTAADGWTQPRPMKGQDFNKTMGEAVARWLKDHADTYRMQRLVVAPAKK